MFASSSFPPTCRHDYCHKGVRGRRARILFNIAKTASTESRCVVNRRFQNTASLARASASPSTARFLPLTTTMPDLDVCLQVARLAEAVSDNVPYVESVAKAAVIIFELLQQMGKNKEDAKELYESIANMIIIIDTLVRFKGEQGVSCFIDICGEMEGYLQAMAQDMKDLQRKHRGM
ncbi:uncharacterized protein EV420DRAFT_1562081, partial [Desarmillaria tabescens]